MGGGGSKPTEDYELLKQDDLESVGFVDEEGSLLDCGVGEDSAVQDLVEGQEVETLIASDCVHDERKETMLSIALEILLPFLLAGFGMVAAGVVLDTVQHWGVFQEMSELFILVPALLGLKGNLEMTLASRLSTQANIGNMDSRSRCVSIVSSNLALIQCQGIVVGFIASLFASTMDFISTRELEWRNGLLVCAASIVTASIASFVLGLVMALVIVASRACNINPDNVATPIAASLGDLITLILLSWIASRLYNDHTNDGWLAPTVIVIYALFVPLCVYVAWRNDDVRRVLYTGWTPVLLAMCISSLGGLILNKAVNKFQGIAVFQPVFNGVGGNLVAVQASRLSTYLHQRAALGVLPKEEHIWVSPHNIVAKPNSHSHTCRILLLLAVPGHLVFALTISAVNVGHTTITPVFFVFYLPAALFQIWILLWSAHCMVMRMWKGSVDPDNAAIPYLTALGDLLGGALLAGTFELLYLTGDRDADVGD